MDIEEFSLINDGIKILITGPIKKLHHQDYDGKRVNIELYDEYSNRPFNNTSEMNEYIIQKWNSVVKDDDIVYHLGDVGFGSLEQMKRLIVRLNGTKILLKGNHDFKIGTNAWNEIGFSEVYKKKIILDNLLLTHAPTEEE